MKSFFQLLCVLLFFSILSMGCQSKDNNIIKDYFVGVEEYLHEIDTFIKDIPELVQNNELEMSRINLIENRIEQMKEEIELFRSLVPPETLKKQHEAALTYNNSFEFLLEQSLREMKKENFLSEQSKFFLTGYFSTNVQNNLSHHLKYLILEKKQEVGHDGISFVEG
ncbi:DUF6376 family protein [Evansella sp. AB-P1]|uniref:DUF6376 family protein n=1 Tax=Evansella sp. AB-P1 TaxID=3037653 RepID=UPI00241CE79C|nr:DUF6376 family protein [Evansella sp. AB-P1]MDG5788500.1 DUF6376 family protein [Evansella sp. AB-P1]